MKLKKLLTTAGLAFSFSLFLGLSAKAADGTTMETATTLSLDGEAHKNGMTEDNYVYWYKCTIPNDIGNKWVNFSCTNNINQRVEFTVYDAEETALDSHTLDTKESWTLKCKVPDSAASEDFPLTEPGKTYYIKAEGYIADSASGKYTVQIKTVSDDNWGTMEQAPEFTIGQKTSGTLEMYGDIDYYKFTIPEIPEDEEIVYVFTSFYSILENLLYCNTSKLRLGRTCSCKPTELNKEFCEKGALDRDFLWYGYSYSSI